MEAETTPWQRFKTILLFAVLFSLFLFPMLTNKEAWKEVGEPEVSQIPNTNKIQITLFPAKKANGMRMYSLLSASGFSGSSEPSYHVVPGNIPNALAVGNFVPESRGSGAYKRVVLRSDNSHAAGYLEGYLTADLIFDFFNTILKNVLPILIPQNSIEKLRQSFSLFAEYLQQIFHNNNNNTNKETSAFWSGLYWQWRRLEGLYLGYNDRVNSSQKLSLGDFLLLNSLWEIQNIAQYVLDWKPKKWTSMTTQELWKNVFLQYLGSTFVMREMKSRLQHVHIMFLPFEKDKYKLAKIYKEFFIDTPTSTVSKRDISFVSYPGVITNIDTFTLVNNWLLIAHNLFASERLSSEKFLPKDTHSNCLLMIPSFLRSSVANLLANSPLEWIQIYTQCLAPFSGNSQFLITNVQMLSTSQTHPREEILLLEESGPNFIVSDLSKEFHSKGLLMTTCRPHHSEILSLSGWNELSQQQIRFLCPSADFLHSKSSGLYNLVEDLKDMIMSTFFRNSLNKLMLETKWNIDVVEEGLITNE